MRDWVGDWGFEPQIAALVERAGVLPAVSVAVPPMPLDAAAAAAMMPPPPPLLNFVPPPQVPFSGLGSARGTMNGKPPPPMSQSYLPYTTGFADPSLLAVDNGALPDLSGVEVLDWAALGV